MRQMDGILQMLREKRQEGRLKTKRPLLGTACVPSNHMLNPYCLVPREEEQRAKGAPELWWRAHQTRKPLAASLEEGSRNTPARATAVALPAPRAGRKRCLHGPASDTKAAPLD